MRKRTTRNKQSVALGYVNPTMHSGVDGIISADRFFALNPKHDPTRQADLSFFRKGGVKFVVLSEGNPDPALFDGSSGFEYVTRTFTALRQAIEKRVKECAFVENRRGLMGRDSRVRFLLHLTGCPINGCLQNLEALYYLGVRAVHPFLNQAEVGGFTGGSPRQGLTKFGREVIRHAQGLRMVVDLTHSNDRTFREALRICKGPVINSHTACRKLRDNFERNSTDDQLKAIADTGGVVGVHFSSNHLWHPPAGAIAHRQSEIKKLQIEVEVLRKKYKNPYEFLHHRFDSNRWAEVLGGAIRGKPVLRAPLDRLVEHILHMLEVAGENHVGLGSDYSLGDICGGVTQAKNISCLATALEQRGVKGPVIEKVMWGNWLRVYREVLL